MRTGLKKNYFKILGNLSLLKFKIINFLFGFNSANNYLKRANKYSIIKILKRYGAQIGNDCDIETGLTFHNCSNYSNLIVGNNCHIGKECFFDLRNEIIINDNVTISMRCTFITHIDMTKTLLSKIYKANSAKIIIGHDSYIGANSIILKGLSIGYCSLIAAGTVVNKDISNNFLVAGVPVKEIKKLDGIKEIN